MIKLTILLLFIAGCVDDKAHSDYQNKVNNAESRFDKLFNEIDLFVMFWFFLIFIFLASCNHHKTEVVNLAQKDSDKIIVTPVNIKYLTYIHNIEQDNFIDSKKIIKGFLLN